LFLATSLAAVGCKKKDDPAMAAAPAGAAAKPAETAPAPTPAAAAPTTPPAGGAEIASDDDYMAKGTVLMEKMTDIFKTGGTNCDKIADDLTRFAADNKATLAAVQAYEKAHPEAKKTAEAATKDKTAAFEAAAGPAIGACRQNQKLGEALNKIAPG
jgi:hypothetical protein